MDGYPTHYKGPYEDGGIGSREVLLDPYIPIHGKGIHSHYGRGKGLGAFLLWARW